MSTPQKEQHEAAEADGRDISPDAFQAEPDGIDLAAHQQPADAPKPEVPPPEDDPLNLENSRVPENYTGEPEATIQPAPKAISGVGESCMPAKAGRSNRSR